MENFNPTVLGNNTTSLPVVALIGRPNVGKSTFFNMLTKTRHALVANFAGLTRDRKYGIANISTSTDSGKTIIKKMLFIDTGGIVDGGDKPNDVLDNYIVEQALLAIDEADIILFILDSKTDLTSDDYKLADMLRRQSKKVMVIANKIDGQDPNAVLAELYTLGLGDIIPTAASQKRGLANVQRALIEQFYADELNNVRESDVKELEIDHQNQRLKVAIIGRPNVGKSTLINRILGEERVIACDLPGTTRDSIYIDFDWKANPNKKQQIADRHYTLIDTAGIRRRKNVSQTVEKFSIIQTLQAIEEANVAILLIDAREGIVDQDLHLLGQIIDSGTALLVAVNKWDGLTNDEKQRCKEALDRRLNFISFLSIHNISALHGSGVGDLYESIDTAYRNATLQIRTNELTQIMRELVLKHPPPIVQGHRVKLRYAHAGGQNPPVIVIHGNQVESLPKHYLRYLENAFREHFNLMGTPIRIILRNNENPFKGKKNTLTQRQVNKKRRLMQHAKRKH